MCEFVQTEHQAESGARVEIIIAQRTFIQNLACICHEKGEIVGTRKRDAEHVAELIFHIYNRVLFDHVHRDLNGASSRR